MAVSEGAEEISNSELQVTKDTRTRDKPELDLPMLAAGRGEQEAEGSRIIPFSLDSGR